MADMTLEIFSGKSFSSLLQDIYTNSSEKKRQINKLIEQLRPLVTNATEAAVIVPMIAEYLDVAVKNDEQLVKMAAIVQRLITMDGVGGDDENKLSEAEREKLLEDAEQQLKNIREAEKLLSTGKQTEEVKA